MRDISQLGVRPPFRLGVLTAGLLLGLGASAQTSESAAPASSSGVAGRAALAQPIPALPQADLQDASQIRPGERLSQWLLRQPDGAQAPNLGLAWQVHAETFAQRHLKNTLLVELESWLRQAPNDAQRLQRAQLHAWIERLPVTGRVGLNIADPRWLEANPAQDPVLGADQKLVVSPWPLRTVAVVQPNGTLCQVLHEPGRNVLDYLAACSAGTQADHAWLAQPDGRTFQMNIAAWNEGPVEEPAPGAWLWAPPRTMPVLDAISEGLIKFLGTQGPAPQPTVVSPAQLPARHAAQPRSLEISANDWGEAGLLQTPSARMAQAGNMRVSLSNVYPYSRLSVMFQPFDWMEAGFRYTSISNRIYGITDTQSYKDKSIDLRVRLLEESPHLPQVALGIRDIGGTGLFSSEYLVASKRWHDFDFSLGIGWGNIANGGSLSNPLGVLDDRFKVRPSATGTGNLNFKSMFRGPAAVFGGVHWRTPWDPLTLKLEYDGNDYQGEPLGNVLRRRSPINVGLSYRVSPGIELSAGFERGDKVMVGLSLSSNLAQATAPKTLDEPLPRVSVYAPLHPPGWATTAATIESQTDWTVMHIAPEGDVLHVWVTDTQADYRKTRTERAVAALHAAAPANIRHFVLHDSSRGIAMGTEVIDRGQWLAEQVSPQLPGVASVAPQTDYAPAPAGSAAARVASGEATLGIHASLEETKSAQAHDAKPDAVSAAAATAAAEAALKDPWTAPRDKHNWGIAPTFSPIIGGPDAFVLYQLGLRATGEYRFTERTWLSGAVSLRLADNFDKFTYTAPSNLPRVRTFQREYATSSRVTVPNLQLTHVGQFAPGHYYSVYGGLLESMYAGVGGEWLYRPWHSRVAFGVDVNRVRQRGFKQDFSLRDYEVTTGHATVYWDTGWQGVMARVSVGQYLAGDRGATVDIARRFDNGFVIGAYATKTNVSAAQFGEGSFDKGIYLSIPLDALLPRSTKANVGFLWNPLTRDGGAPLARAQPLYGLTSGADPRMPQIAPPVEKAPRNGDNLLDFENRR